MKGRIVIVDDDLGMCSMLKAILEKEGFKVKPFSTAVEALEALSLDGSLGPEKHDGDIDTVISDINMPHMNGLEFTQRLRSVRPEIPIILLSASGNLDTAIQAIKEGAFHYIIKPFKIAEMIVNLHRALEYRKLQKDNTALRKEIRSTWRMGEVIGKSPKMKEIFDLVARVSRATANVLITGESGTGKEMIARSIHQMGPRAHLPFIAINCTAIPETLLESEFFGHSKGAFTGAFQKKKGLFEEAHGGTLFLDEIGDMNINLQSKLLRVLQERKIRSVGDNKTRSIDVRIITATHKDLRTAVREGTFREDFFYRLSVIPITLPPLRERQEDIPYLADYFLKKYSASNDSKIKGFTQRAIQKLLKLRWEGNVRELENVIERAVVLSTHSLIDESDIPSLNIENADHFFNHTTSDFPTLDQLEARYIRLVLQKMGGHKQKTAQILGVNRRTLCRKEQEYALDHPSTLRSKEIFNSLSNNTPVGMRHESRESV